MTRRFALELLAAGHTWAQRPDRQVEPVTTATEFVIDAVAVDSSGNPVRDLAPGDFTIMERSETRAVTSFASIGTVSGAARAAPPLPLPMKIDPGEVHRTFIVVVDDTGISEASATALRDMLLRFVNEGIGPRDCFALIRTSGGNGQLEAISSDKQTMRAAIEQIVFNPAAAPPPVPPWRHTLEYAVEAVRQTKGRKAVALFWERSTPSCIFDSVIGLANRTWASIYTIHCGEMPAALGCNMAELTAATGGLSLDNPATALDRVLQSESSYYLLGFHSSAADSSAAGHVSVKVSRPGVQVRSHNRPASITAADNWPQDTRSMFNPAESSSVGTWITPVFIHATGNWVNVHLWVDARTLAFTHQLNGTHSAGLSYLMRIYDANAIMVDERTNSVSLALTSEQYEELLDTGVRISSRVQVAKPGVYQVHARLFDATSTNTGAVHRLVEVPDVSKGDLLLSGITLLLAADRDKVDELSFARRSFRASQEIGYTCFVYNAAADDQKRSVMEVRTNLYTGGRAVFQGAPIRLTANDAAKRSWLTLHGKLELGPTTTPGDFVVEIAVTDKVQSRTVSQWTDFTLR